MIDMRATNLRIFIVLQKKKNKILAAEFVHGNFGYVHKIILTIIGGEKCC